MIFELIERRRAEEVNDTEKRTQLKRKTKLGD